MSDLLPSIGVLVKLGSLAVHIEELFSPGGNATFDKPAIETILHDEEVQQWLKLMGKNALLPVTRTSGKRRKS